MCIRASWWQTAITYLGPAVVIVALLSVLRVILQTIAERLDGTAPDAREHHEEAD